MKVPFVDLSVQYHSIKDEIDEAIQRTLNDGWFIGGDAVSTFESEFADYLGVKNCVTCGNGTDALEIALEALNIGSGDEVIVPAMSWISTSGAVSRVGAKPVFVDVLQDRHTINPDLVASKISSKTRAIIAVHLYGKPAELSELVSLCKESNIKLIEDCAQAHGAEYEEKKVGSFAVIATWSFYPTKNLGAYGDAGCVTTEDAELAEKCRLISNYGQPKRNVHELEGRNSRMDTLQAAVLSVKLKHLDEWVARKREIAGYYNATLKNSGLKLPADDEPQHAYYQYVVESENRDLLKLNLEYKGIETQIHYPKALPSLKPYVDSQNISEFSLANLLADRCLSLPIYPELSQEQLFYVVNSILEVLEN